MDSNEVVPIPAVEVTAWRKQWSHKPTPIPHNAGGLWYSEECVDQMLQEYCAERLARAESENERLKAEIAGFPNLAAMRQAMIDTADENARLEAQLKAERESKL